MSPAALPVGVRRVTISESYVGASGTSNGIVIMTPQTSRVVVSDVEVLLQPVRSELKNGQLTIEILVPPVEIVWQVREAVGPQRLNYYVIVPGNAVDQQLSALARTAAPPVAPGPAVVVTAFGTTAGTAAEGNDPRIVSAPGLNAPVNTYTGRQMFTGGASLYGVPLPSIMPATKTLWQDSTWRQNFQTGHGWTTGGAGTLSSDVNSTAQFCKGTQAVRVTTTGTGVQSQVRKTALPAMDLTGKAIRLTFRVDDTTKLDRIALYVGSGGFANYFQWTFHTHSSVNPNYVDSGEWVTVTLHWSDVQQAAGTYTLTNGNPSTKTGFTDLQFALYDINGPSGLTYHLQSIEFIPDATAVFPNGVISLTFDDSYASVYDLARPLLDANGQRATTYNIADVIGGANPAYMTMAQLRATQDISGWEAAGHAYYNASHSLTNGLRDLTEAACDEEFQRLKLWMMRNGLNSDNFAYPKGHFGSTLDGKRIDEIAARYWATSRTIISETMENLHPAMPQRVHARTGMSTTAHVNSFLATGGALDKIYNNGGWYILCLHKIVTGVVADGTEINVNDLTTLLNGIATKGVPVRPVSEVVRFYQRMP